MPSDDEIGRRRLADIRHHWAGTKAKLEALIAKAEQLDIKPEKEERPARLWTPSLAVLAYVLIGAVWCIAMVLLMWGGR